ATLTSTMAAGAQYVAITGLNGEQRIRGVGLTRDDAARSVVDIAKAQLPRSYQNNCGVVGLLNVTIPPDTGIASSCNGSRLSALIASLLEFFLLKKIIVDLITDSEEPIFIDLSTDSEKPRLSLCRTISEMRSLGLGLRRTLSEMRSFGFGLRRTILE